MMYDCSSRCEILRLFETFHSENYVCALCYTKGSINNISLTDPSLNLKTHLDLLHEHSELESTKTQKPMKL